jgi:hypothetical protein
MHIHLASCVLKNVNKNKTVPAFKMLRKLRASPLFQKEVGLSYSSQPFKDYRCIGFSGIMMA